MSKIIFFAVFFIFSYQALASESSVEVNLQSLAYGQYFGVVLEGGPFFIVRRSKKEVALLNNKYGAGNFRSTQEQFFIVRNFASSESCVLQYTKINNNKFIGTPVFYTGGFIDHCTGSQFDLSGRVILSTPGNKTVLIPVAKHEYTSSNSVVVFGNLYAGEQ